jgi:hypothetical protein
MPNQHGRTCGHHTADATWHVIIAQVATMQPTQERTAAPDKCQLLMQSTSIAPSKHKQATGARMPNMTASRGHVTETANTVGTAKG